ncbi:MAG: helix-turn-helix domain-containing protein [Armatimonadetes bacterium]|nr:helix-turn-helix domain-containing protein [Armatimonadota bacterium]
MATTESAWITVREAAAELGCTDTWVRDLVRRARLRSKREYGRTVVSRADVLHRKACPSPPGRPLGARRSASSAVAEARRAIRDAVVGAGAGHVEFSAEALDRAYQLLVAADPHRKSGSLCGALSVGFQVRGEDYEDAPSDD